MLMKSAALNETYQQIQNQQLALLYQAEGGIQQLHQQPTYNDPLTQHKTTIHEENTIDEDYNNSSLKQDGNQDKEYGGGSSMMEGEDPEGQMEYDSEGDDGDGEFNLQEYVEAPLTQKLGEGVY